MVDVTRHNFDTVYSQFEKELKTCSYVSLDSEFSYLPSDDFENSFFDDGKERYLKLKNHLQNTVILQVGLSLFTFKRDLKRYDASLYRFYIVPRPFGPLQKSLLFKSSNIQFLCNNKFDFNKCFYDGMSYLSNSQENVIRKLLKNGNLIDSIDKALDYNDRESVSTHGSAITSWLINSSPGDVYSIPVETSDLSYRYFVHQEIRRRFANVWTFNNEDSTEILVKHVSKEDKKNFEMDHSDPVNSENLIQSLLGFSKVFKLLSSCKKPLIGHNLMLDLIIMYSQFYQELPSSYVTFKKNLNELFPKVFDTKLMMFHIQKELNKVLLHDTSLGKLYDLFQDRNGLVYQPYVHFNPGIYSKDEIEQLHDAGWDSYFTGFCFIKLSYYLINSKNSYHNNVMSVITFKECLHSVSNWCNQISVARANIPYMNLSGNDPISKRPPILYICWKNGKPIRRNEVIELFKNYGPVHKKEYTPYSLLLATSHFGCYKEILRDFKQHKDLRVEKFSLLRHHTGLKVALCLGLLLPVGWTFWYKKPWIT